MANLLIAARLLLMAFTTPIMQPAITSTLFYRGCILYDAPLMIKVLHYDLGYSVAVFLFSQQSFPRHTECFFLSTQTAFYENTTWYAVGKIVPLI